MQTTSPIACILVPELPIAAQHPGKSPELPLAVHRGKTTQARILWCNAGARELGVTVGQTLAAARARASELDSALLDEKVLFEKRQRVLARLILHSPRVRPDGPTRFWAEPTALGHSEQPGHLHRWCGLVRGALDYLGPVAIGVGSTATIAYASACHVADGVHIIAPSYERSFLDAAPLSVLELATEELETFQALGVQDVETFRKLEPIELGMRFGQGVADAWRRAEGSDARGPATTHLSAPDQVCIELDDEIGELQPLIFLLRSGVEQLLKSLRARSLGTTTVELCLRAPDGNEHLIEVRTAEPIHDPRTLLELLRTRLERTSLEQPIAVITLRASTVAEATGHDRDLFGRVGRDPGAREVVLDRLRSRFGAQSVKRASRLEVGSSLARAQWLCSGPPLQGEASPWRRIDPPIELQGHAVELAGLRRRILQIGRTERTNLPWWLDGNWKVDRYAWAELEGPLLALLMAKGHTWQLVAWMD